jgi:hypothetical protein
MFLNGALRQCKSLSGYQRYFSLETLKQRWSAQCVKPITQPQDQRFQAVMILFYSVALRLSLQIFHRANPSYI